jgi:hypothetical protein
LASGLAREYPNHPKEYSIEEAMFVEKRGSSAMDVLGQRAHEDEDGTASGMRTAETMLRLVPMALCVAALVVMLKNSQTSDYGSLSYSDLGAFRYVQYVLSFSSSKICLASV